MCFLARNQSGMEQRCTRDRIFPFSYHSRGTHFSLELSVKVYPGDKSRLATWSCCGNYKCNWMSRGSQILTLFSVTVISMTVEDSRDLLCFV